MFVPMSLIKISIMGNIRQHDNEMCPRRAHPRASSVRWIMLSRWWNMNESFEFHLTFLFSSVDSSHQIRNEIHSTEMIFNFSTQFTVRLTRFFFFRDILSLLIVRMHYSIFPGDDRRRFFFSVDRS